MIPDARSGWLVFRRQMLMIYIPLKRVAAASAVPPAIYNGRRLSKSRWN